MQAHTFFLYLLVILLTARLFAELGRFSGIFNNEVHAGLVIVIVLTTIIPPFAMKWLYKHYGGQLLVSK